MALRIFPKSRVAHRPGAPGLVRGGAPEGAEVIEGGGLIVPNTEAGFIDVEVPA